MSRRPAGIAGAQPRRSSAPPRRTAGTRARPRCAARGGRASGCPPRDRPHAGRARGARRAYPRATRPRQRRAVRLRGVGGREHLHLVGPFAQLAEPLDRAAERELRAAETLDEVAAPAEPERLERAQLRVHRAVAARDALGADAVTGDDALPLEQQLRERAPVGRAREQPLGARPAALSRGHGRRSCAGKAPWPPLRLWHAVATA